MTEEPFASGRCLCGGVTFSVSAAPIAMGQCHCVDCQRATGTGHVSNARFRADDVSINGETKTFAVTAASGNTNTRYFCPTCGSRLFTETTLRPGLINVHAGVFDDHTWFDPQWVLFKSAQPVWDITTEEVPCYEGMPPPPPPA